ncbi:spermidine synthase [Salinibaculum rarum]|uniref:spermidine synthase n=1 Tax=Salinibaculum rarum TaxID=3058903 RepID=UPI00265D9C7F|nr:spermidine synthase [Salinibaculum sp. KK48]
MTQHTLPRSRKVVLLIITFLVSFCSFAYEFVYSEELTVMYGSTVTQYVITIGLFFFALGLGSTLVDNLATDNWENFTRLELYLATVSTTGFVGIILLNSIQLPPWFPRTAEIYLARLPPVLVGFLSGFELPYLTKMVNIEADDTGSDLPMTVRRLGAALHTTIHRILSVFFHTSTPEGSRSGFSLTLSADYFGGLVGALIYAKYLYPTFGLIPTVFILAFLNVLAALLFVARFSGTSWGVFSGDAPTGGVISHDHTAVVLALLVLTAGYGGVLMQHDTVERDLTAMYLEQTYEEEYTPTRGSPPTMDVEVTNQFTTNYQHVVKYTRTWEGTGPNPYFNGTTETCLRLDTAVQMCDSWADSYHNGLVDVPMAMYENSTQTNVLLIGGGDHVALNHLREYNVSVDRVDLDGEFMRWARNASFLQQWHENAYKYPNQTTTVGDGYTYVRNTDTTYDVILLDIPGAKDNSLLKMYSVEFYQALRDNLERDGVVVTWGYTPTGYTQHYHAYMNTVSAAGFEDQMQYWAREDIDGDKETERVELFYMFSPHDRTGKYPTRAGGAYVHRHEDRYATLQWTDIPTFNGIDSNSIFDPNYDILINP